MHLNKNLLHPFLMFAIASFFYLYEFLLRVIPTVMEPQLRSAFELDAKQYGILAAIYFAAYAPLQLPVGALIDKYGTRKLLTGAIILCALSTLISAYTTNYYLALLARFFIGAGSAFGFISCMKVLTLWFPVSWFSVMTGVTLTIGTLGAAAAWPISYAMRYIEWQTLLVILGCVGLVIGVIAWLVIRDKNESAPHPEELEEERRIGFWGCLKEVAARPQAWFVGIYAFLVTAPTDAFGGAWGVPFLTNSHLMSKEDASFAQSMVFVGMAVGSPLLGYVAKLINNRKIPMFAAGILSSCALFALIFMPGLTPGLAALLCFAFGAFGTYVLAFVVIRHVIEDKFVGTAVGFVNMLSTVGSLILTSVVGCILDMVRSGDVDPETNLPIYLWQDYQYGLFALPVFYAIATLVIVPMIVDKPAKRKVNV